MEHSGIDVVILTFRPREQFLRLLDMLEKQTVKPGKIIIINTEEEQFTIGERVIREHPRCEVHHISKREFDHGGTRNYAAGFSGADFLIFMTQDAVPYDRNLLKELLGPMEEERVAISYARQLPSKSAGEIERYNRTFNYPPFSRLKTKEDIPKLGIKTIFCSDVCACYRRSVFDRLGGFTENVVFNEDMIFAFSAVMNGFGIYYASGAGVVHSHEYTFIQQFKRNFDLGASQSAHQEVFSKFKSEGEGKRLVKGCISNLLRKGRIDLIPVFIFHCAARYGGFLLGKNYRFLKPEIILKVTSDRAYWEKYFGMQVTI